MRFYENGIDIPDELLYAHDAGKVVFICGSGVSKAKAQLPDFKKLCTDVVNRLGEPQGTLIRKRLRRKEVAFDRIFGMLEREYQLSTIEEFVAKSLKPKNNDLSTHRTLMKLAKEGTKDFRLITTNFDTLFEKTKLVEKDEIYIYPHLPNLDRTGGLNGLVYLHGRVNNDYSGSDDGGFILTSSSFGRAYLADGWAKDFLTQVISKYTIVFIGYQADDPPVYYLLEALHDTKKNMYAFCDENEFESISEWDARGVKPVKFENKDLSFSHLWKTLDLWAERASNKKEWFNGIMKLAENDPKKLDPWQRTQVVHLVSTCAGMRAFCNHKPAPHPEWLCVFDPKIRYSQPGKLDLIDPDSKFVHPFNEYGLDCDKEPLNVISLDNNANDEIDFKAQYYNDPFSANKTQKMAVNCFKANVFDDFPFHRIDVCENFLIPSSSVIPQRIDKLLLWISNQIHKP